MAIKFLNIKSGEVRVAESEPHIAAMWASSDHSPNITQGQDFGWRLAPEDVVEMKHIKQDFDKLTHIASRLQKNVDEVTEPDILMYISSQHDAQTAPVATEADYQDDYDAEVQRQAAARQKENQAHVDPEIDQVPPVLTDDPIPGVDAISQPTDTHQTSNPTQPKEQPPKPEKPNKPAK